MKRVIITGIGTGVGKTLVASIFVRALNGDYWKPVQAGSLKCSDSYRIGFLSGAPPARIHPERFRLRYALSPHAAAGRENIRIRIKDLVPPETSRPLVIEGAGGLFVPFNARELMVDFFEQLKAPVVLVSRHYLGSINHTLLSAEALQARKISMLGIVFNGRANPETEAVILQRTGLPLLLRIEPEPGWDSNSTKKYAYTLRRNLKRHELV